VARSKEQRQVVRPEHSAPVFERARRLAKALFGQEVTADVVLWSDGGESDGFDPQGALRIDPRGYTAIIDSRELLWVADTAQHAKVRDLTAAYSADDVRFCAAAPMRLDDGTIPGVLAVAGPRPRPYDAELAARLQDLADFVSDEWIRLRAAQANEVANGALANVLNCAPLWLVVTDRQMRLLSASEAWFRRAGLDPTTSIGESLYDLEPHHFGPQRALFERCLEGADHFFERSRAVERDGRVVWIQGQLAPWREANGEIGGLTMVSHDVTPLAEALEGIERSEGRLKVAIDAANLWVWDLDLTTWKIRWLGGLSPVKRVQDEEGDPWAHMDRRDIPAVKAAWARRNPETTFRTEFRLRSDDQREVWVECATHTVCDARGAPTRLIGAFKDITARKTQELALIQAKEFAEESNRAKSTFLATISHEIRTPLNGIMGMVQVMARDDLPTPQRERLDVIRSSSEGLLGILNELLDISKIEAGKLTLEESEFDMGELAKAACGPFRAVAENKSLAFRVKVTPAARGAYRGDAMRVRQIVQNLISNALKFTESGLVEVVIGRRADEVQITVRDTGIGMTAAQVKKLFRAYQQAETSTSRRYGGTGLGLAICRELTELMGGRISVVSAPGKGACFTARLPLPKLDAGASPAVRTQEAPARIESGQPERALRVLAAEDNGVNQLVLKTLLNQIGIEPVMVGDGRSAVEAWSRETWDLILMDVQMPVMDGPAAAAEIRTREAAEGRARTPIVALTANAMESQVRQYLDAGMDGHVAKPIAAAQLFAALQTALERAGAPGAQAAA
jgi:PAS domain S-box-containing protein